MQHARDCPHCGRPGIDASERYPRALCPACAARAVGGTGSLLDLTSGAPSVTWIQAIEPTRTVAIRYADFNTLASQHSALESLARALAQSLAIRKTKREYEMLALSAQERLAIWRAENPGLDGRITRRLLAFYLGITPVHLSRITSERRKGTMAAPRGMGLPPR